MFRTTGPSDEGRREPTLFSAPRLPSPDSTQLDTPEGSASVTRRQRADWRGPVGSLVLHLLPLLLLLEWPMAVSPETMPIAVQLVVEPPPPEHAPRRSIEPPPLRIPAISPGDRPRLNVDEAMAQPFAAHGTADQSPIPTRANAASAGKERRMGIPRREWAREKPARCNGRACVKLFSRRASSG